MSYAAGHARTGLFSQRFNQSAMTILDKIVAAKREEIDAQRRAMPEAELRRRLADALPVRDFRAALDHPRHVRVIAEVKKASPSAGVLRPDFDPVAIARIYAAHGAAAISVLTDAPFFQGSLADLTSVRDAVPLPVLRKDFILDQYQILQARVAGSDAVLLIAEILDDANLRTLLHAAQSLGMAALVELYERDNLPRVLAAGATVIGINNRDLRTFATRLEHTIEMAAQVPTSCCLVSESGIRSRADVARLQAVGVKAILVGESLLRAADIGAKLVELTGR
jgi:indole-3-glycerol phosphate synthase